MKAVYLGVVGPNGSGKSSVCDVLKKRGFTILSLSDIVRQEAKKQNRTPTRDHLIQTANELKSEFGLDILAKKSIEIAKSKKLTHVVFDSVRNNPEMTYLKSEGATIIGITASIETRFKRIEKRKKDTDQVDFATFKEQCDKEFFGRSSGQHIQEALKACDVMVDNSGALSDLSLQITDILFNVEKKKEVKKL
jgi:dephospho-CoA kinase